MWPSVSWVRVHLCPQRSQQVASNARLLPPLQVSQGHGLTLLLSLPWVCWNPGQTCTGTITEGLTSFLPPPCHGPCTFCCSRDTFSVQNIPPKTSSWVLGIQIAHEIPVTPPSNGTSLHCTSPCPLYAGTELLRTSLCPILWPPTLRLLPLLGPETAMHVCGSWAPQKSTRALTPPQVRATIFRIDMDFSLHEKSIY